MTSGTRVTYPGSRLNYQPENVAHCNTAHQLLHPFMTHTWPIDVWSSGLVIAEIDHLTPVAFGAAAATNIAQLLAIWKLCQSAAAPRALTWFEDRVKR